MRRVKFKDYDKEKKEWIEGEGVFHQWGNTFEEFENGGMQYTFAIVEGDGGIIYEVAPHHLQFLDAPTPSNF